MSLLMKTEMRSFIHTLITECSVNNDSLAISEHKYTNALGGSIRSLANCRVLISKDNYAYYF